VDTVGAVSSRLKAIARETVSIAEQGGYGTVDIASDVARAVAGTRLYLPADSLSVPTAGGPAAIEVTAESSLEAARRLGADVACLVFASARNPGGGFLNGAKAQEESVARSSALYPCLLKARDFYAHHRAHPELTYTDRVIYAPHVPVFRDDKGTLLDEPYSVSFLIAAAPNTGAIARNQPEYLPEVPAILARRAARILAVAAAHGHRRLVLGAWGCGVFGDDPATVAAAFAAALESAPWFDTVVFAVLDGQREAPTLKAFHTALLPG
jgi:uncharacterized protein (TIGR02452 family)